MGQFKYVPEREVLARHQRHKVARGSKASRLPVAPPTASRLRNVEPVLSLGETTYFQFRGRAYGVPPLPWKPGQRLLQVYNATLTAAGQVALTGDKEAEQVYFRGLARIQSILWAYCRPVGRVRRVLRFLRFIRNPFTGASEKEVLELADFFLQGRTRSAVQPWAPTTTDHHPTLTPWMT